MSCILLRISSDPIHRPRINTPAILDAAAMFTSGFSSTRSRSVCLPTAIVPALSLSPRYSKGLVHAPVEAPSNARPEPRAAET